MTLAVHADLHQRLRHGKALAREVVRFDAATQICTGDAGNPFQLVTLSLTIKNRDAIEPVGHARFRFGVKRPPDAQREPKAVREDHVMEKFQEFLIRRRAFANRSNQRSICPGFVPHQILDHRGHAM